MARIIYKDQEKEIDDGESIISTSTELGVPFMCRRGKCGACVIKVVSGMENLSSRVSAEDILGLAEDERLACRCHIKKGEIEIDF